MDYTTDWWNPHTNVEGKKDMTKTKVSDINIINGEVVTVPEVKHENPREKAEQAWKNYAEGSTVHGIRYVSDSNSRVFRRVFWLIFLMGMMATLVYAIHAQFWRYMDFKTITKESILFDEELRFPAVTMCNFNRIKNSTVTNATERKLLLELFGLHYRGQNFTLEQLRNLGEDYLNTVELDRIFDTNSHTLPETIVFCLWMGLQIPCDLIVMKTRTDFGTCFTFNSLEQSKNFSSPVTATRTGSDFGFTAVLFANQDEYFVGDSAVAGFKVLVHDQNEEPDIQQSGISISPGFVHFMSIEKREIIFRPSPSKAFGDKSCLDTEDPGFKNPLEMFSTYTYNACQKECQVKYMYRMCGCKGVNDPGDYPVCKPLVLAGCYALHQLIFSFISTSNCSCSVPCKLILYDVRTDFGYYPNDNYLQLVYGGAVEFSQEWVRKNYLQVRVFFKSKLIHRREQVLEYGEEDLAASIGGYLGLCFGASLNSIVEFMEFLLFGIMTCLK